MDWVLVIYMGWAGSGAGDYSITSRYKTLQECYAALDTVDIFIPEAANENEWAGLKACIKKPLIENKNNRGKPK